MVRLFLRLPSARPSRSGLLFVLFWAVMVGSGAVEAATIIVTNTADNGAGSLRAAIAAAVDGDTIQFDAALNGQTIGLTGGALAIDQNITVSGPGPNLLAVSRVSTASRFRIFTIMPGRTVTLAGLTISGGYGDGGGVGGIASGDATLTISNCIVSGNFSDGGTGGGIGSSGTLTIVDSVVSFNRASNTTGFPMGSAGGIASSGTLTIIRSTISDNTALIHCGGIIGDGIVIIIDSTISGNRSGSNTLPGTGLGGGLCGGGTVEIRGSTISGNTASGENSGLGGGIRHSGQLTISNSTISGNFANQDGGGIRSFTNGTATLTITNSAISDNWATRNGAGIIITNAGSLTLVIGNTILSNSGTNIVNEGGTVTSHGYNLSNDNGGGFLTAPGDQINTNPMLSPLQDNGGPTFTQIPLTGSPALDAGDPNFTPPPLNDQRGVPYVRVFNGRIDIGSVEVQPSPTPTPTPTPTGTPTPTPTPSSTPARALNISTRLRVETGDNVMIGGFIVTGTQPRNVALRGLGPSLGGVGITDTLVDPSLELRAANGMLLFQNDNWQDDPAQAALLISLGLAPQNSNESGIVATIQPGASYTAVLAGANGGAGVGLVEIYDVDPTANSQLANISTRGFVQTGDNVMIGGFILGGSPPEAGATGIVVRGIGPSLAQFGLSNPLADPTLELRDSNGALLVSNDDWQDDPMQAAQLNAHGLAPQDPKESGIFATLPPGAFTAILAGTSGGTGIGLVEIYNVQ